MPFTVITLKKVPESLRGDLTRWMQEIATGVYVGNFNSKVRENLWNRVIDTAGQGEAIMCFSCRNEIGYSFCTYNTQRTVVDYDGIPLVLIPAKEEAELKTEENVCGYSNASKYHKAIRKVKANINSDSPNKDNGEKSSAFSEKSTKQGKVFIDIETTGLDAETDDIIEIGAIKIEDDQKIVFHRFIQIDKHIPEKVSELTGISNKMLQEGTSLESCVYDLSKFVQGTVLVGYNISFDIRFLNKAFKKYSLELIQNKTVDLMKEAKKRNSFQNNYKFETTLKEYGINQKIPHRAVEDAELVYRLYKQMGLK